jgi:hypothetical protein
VVGPDFFSTLGVPLLAGRDFADSDNVKSPHVGIINEEFAKRFLPNTNPLGHTIGTDDGQYTMTIVGVVKNHKYRSIDEDPIPMAWYMYAQIPYVGGMSVEMRVHGDPLAILPSARKAVQGMDPNLTRPSLIRSCLRGSPGSSAFLRWCWWPQGSMERWHIA